MSPGRKVIINGGVINAGGSFGIGSGDSGSDVEITLDYTDDTKDSISVTASSFGGMVTLEKPFVMYGKSRPFYAGTVGENRLLENDELTFWNGKADDWQMLLTAVSTAPQGDTVTLGRDVYADGTSDSALYVVSGRNITIDLNGFTMDRGLTDMDPSECGSEGYVIRNNGTLTINDSAGTGVITGGNCSDRAGGIYNSGILTINGGSITGNASATWGGGIYLPDNTNAVLNLNDGSITGNTCGNNGGGVHVSGTATMNVSGSPVVSGNTKNGEANNVCLAGGGVLHVTGPLSESAVLGVFSSGGAAVITSGLAGNGSISNFFSDSDAFAVGLEEEGEYAGEAVLEDAHTVTFDPGDENATGDMPGLKVGRILLLPACGYRVAGKAFMEWSVKVGDNEPVPGQPGGRISVTADVIVTAVWLKCIALPESLTRIEEGAFEGIAAECVKVPASVNTIEARAFADCASLRAIYIPATVTGVNNLALDGCENVTVHGVRGTEAERFAIAAGFTFAEMNGDPE